MVHIFTALTSLCGCCSSNGSLRVFGGDPTKFALQYVTFFMQLDSLHHFFPSEDGDDFMFCSWSYLQSYLGDLPPSAQVRGTVKTQQGWSCISLGSPLCHYSAVLNCHVHSQPLYFRVQHLTMDLLYLDNFTVNHFEKTE